MREYPGFCAGKRETRRRYIQMLRREFVAAGGSRRSTVIERDGVVYVVPGESFVQWAMKHAPRIDWKAGPDAQA